MPAFLKRWWRGLTSEVPQDPYLILFGKVNRKTVQLRPVLENGVIAEWIPDPLDVAPIQAEDAESAYAAHNGTGGDKTAERPVEAPPSLPTDAGRDIDPAASGL